MDRVADLENGSACLHEEAEWIVWRILRTDLPGCKWRLNRSFDGF